MASNSALVGTPPNDQLDRWLLKALFKNKVPKISAPPGYHHESRGGSLIAGVSMAIFFILLFTGARLGVRYYSKRMRMGPDDYMIIPAALLNIAFLCTIIARVPLAGIGDHLWDVTYVEAARVFEIGNVSQVLFFAAVTTTKLSITFFNRRLTGISSKRWKYVHNGFLVILVIFFFVSLFLNIFQCNPVHFRYNYALRGENPTGYKCLDAKKLNSAFCIFHAVTDFMLLSVPVIVLSRVKLPLTTKIRLCMLFAIGAVSCVSSAMRIVVGNWSTPDFTWSFPTTIVWTVMDCTTGVIVASLPALNTLIDYVWPKEWSMRKRKFSSLPFSSNTGSRSRNATASAGAGASVSSPAQMGGVMSKDEIDWDYPTSTEEVNVQREAKGAAVSERDPEKGGMHGP